MGRRGGFSCWLLNCIDYFAGRTWNRCEFYREAAYPSGRTTIRRCLHGLFPIVYDGRGREADRGAFLLHYNGLRRFAAVAWNNLLVSSRI